MDRNITLNIRWLVVAGLVALALVVAYLVGNARSAPARAAETGSARTVTVTGLGHVLVVPDQLGFDLSVHVLRTDLDTALDDSNAAMQRVIDTLEDAGVAEKDIQTTDLSMNPEYSRKRGQPTVFKGYRVSQTVTVVVGDLTKASDIVTAAVSAGGTNVRLYGLRLQVGDPDAALKPARTDAYQQAVAKAEEYAADTGLELGDVVKVSDVSQNLDHADEDMAYAASGSYDSAEIPFQPGQTDLTASVVVVLELE